MHPAGSSASKHEFATVHTLGWVQEMQGRTAEARHNYEAVIAVNPTHFYATNNYCDLLLRVERSTDQVLAACERAVEAKPDHGQNHFLLAQYHQNVYGFAAAERHLLKAIDLDIKAGAFSEGHPAAHRSSASARRLTYSKRAFALILMHVWNHRSDADPRSARTTGRRVPSRQARNEGWGERCSLMVGARCVCHEDGEI